jgi:hypothetical protein
MRNLSRTEMKLSEVDSPHSKKSGSVHSARVKSHPAPKRKRFPPKKQQAGTGISCSISGDFFIKICLSAH